MYNINLKGLYPASILPFTADDKVDYDGFKKNLQGLIDAGCDVVCVNV
jgi:dihydrodipicolinate synthase/N-acetylneuraminate lyase